jgi:hypothetical protein
VKTGKMERQGAKNDAAGVLIAITPQTHLCIFHTSELAR